MTSRPTGAAEKQRAVLDSAIAKAVAAAPPLTADQIVRLRALFQPSPEEIRRRHKELSELAAADLAQHHVAAKKAVARKRKRAVDIAADAIRRGIADLRSRPEAL